MQTQGRVVSKPVAVGSKSERAAVVLETDSGEYVLRRAGGNPFHDPQLAELVGKEIQATGTLHGYTLIMSQWEEVSGSGAP
jgi:hypothetical protein